jgi:hypothetical protein
MPSRAASALKLAEVVRSRYSADRLQPWRLFVGLRRVLPDPRTSPETTGQEPGDPRFAVVAQCHDLGVKPQAGRAISRPNPTADLAGVEREVSRAPAPAGAPSCAPSRVAPRRPLGPGGPPAGFIESAHTASVTYSVTDEAAPVTVNLADGCCHESLSSEAGLSQRTEADRPSMHRPVSFTPASTHGRPRWAKAPGHRS